MRARGRVIGVITFGASRGSGRTYQADDLRFAEELASRAALAIDNARLYHEAQGAEARYRMLFESNPQPMWVFDAESLAFLAINDAAVRHYGYSREEFLSMTMIDLRPVEETPGLLPSLEHAPARAGARWRWRNTSGKTARSSRWSWCRTSSSPTAGGRGWSHGS